MRSDQLGRVRLPAVSLAKQVSDHAINLDLTETAGETVHARAVPTTYDCDESVKMVAQ